MARMQDCSSEHSRSEKIGAVPPQVACNLGSHGLLWWHDVKFWESIICKAPMTCNATSNAGEVLQFNVGRGVLLLDLGATPDAPGYPGTPDTPDTVLTESPISAALIGAAM